MSLTAKWAYQGSTLEDLRLSESIKRKTLLKETVNQHHDATLYTNKSSRYIQLEERRLFNPQLEIRGGHSYQRREM